jgi:Flp pilus assembly protein TadG
VNSPITEKILMNRFRLLSLIKSQQGAVMVLVAISLFMIIGLTALAVDIGHLVVTKNELQNAADSGALAGARVLYLNDGQAVNPGANKIATDTAVLNASDNTPVEVGTGDVLRGHWSFTAKKFTPNETVLTHPVLWDVSTAELDADLDFINAVQVTTHRDTTPVTSWFARIFGFTGFKQKATAVAYIGFAGSLLPWEIDQPIAICEEALLATGKYSCTVGRMINSGQNIASSETGGWTSLNQGLDGSGNLIDDPCNGGTNSQEVKGLVNTGCGGNGTNPGTLILGKDMATNGGQIQSAFTALYNCWNGQTNKTQPWELMLPVVKCPGNNVTTCQELVGAVTVKVVWITGEGEDPGYNDAPTQMGSWSNSSADGSARWNSFVNHFKLENLDPNTGVAPAPYAKKSIYFLPDCSPHVPSGISGGENFGVMAKIPVLVD